MYRVKEENVSFLPKIPAQPIGYAEAQVILQYTIYFPSPSVNVQFFLSRYLGGIEVNATWRGRLENVTYRYGGIFASTA
jgi:hypothetical protein